MPEDSSPWKTHPWFVLLRLQVSDKAKQFTGTLISSRYVVTAAETFYETKPIGINDAKNPENWKALTGARHIEDVTNVVNIVESNDWIGISRIDIHNLFDRLGYTADNNRYV